MDRVARSPASDRHDLFRETAMLRGVSAEIVEKDFWVCWVLKQIFADPDHLCPRTRGKMLAWGGSALIVLFD